MIKLLNIPFQIGNVPFTKLFQFVSKCVLGIAVNPDFNSPFDLVARSAAFELNPLFFLIYPDDL